MRMNLCDKWVLIWHGYTARGIRQIGDLYLSRGDLPLSSRFYVIAY